MGEIVGCVVQHRVGVLGFEHVCRHKEYALFGIEFANAYADGIDEMGFAYPTRPIQEEGVEGVFSRIFGNAESDAEGEFVALSLYKVSEGVARIKLRIEFG